MISIEISTLIAIIVGIPTAITSLVMARRFYLSRKSLSPWAYSIVQSLLRDNDWTIRDRSSCVRNGLIVDWDINGDLKVAMSDAVKDKKWIMPPAHERLQLRRALKKRHDIISNNKLEEAKQTQLQALGIDLNELRDSQGTGIINSSHD